MKLKSLIRIVPFALVVAMAAMFAFHHFLTVRVMEWGVIADVGKTNQYRNFIVDPKWPQDNAVTSYESDSIEYVDSCCSVREPVQYFYSNIPITMTEEVDFHTGMPAITYPMAHYIDIHKFEWKIHISPIPSNNSRIPQNYARMQNLDAATILTERDTNSFLFYEGSSPVDLSLMISTNSRRDSVIIYNPNDFTILDPCISTMPDYFQEVLKVCFDSVQAKKTVSGTGRSLKDLITRLRRDGLTEAEARAFDFYWGDKMAETYKRPFTVYSYLIPQAEVDKIVSVHFSYPLVEFKRRIFYYHVQINKVPVCKSYCHTPKCIR